jgi:hypothetical protein
VRSIEGNLNLGPLVPKARASDLRAHFQGLLRTFARLKSLTDGFDEAALDREIEQLEALLTLEMA